MKTLLHHFSGPNYHRFANFNCYAHTGTRVELAERKRKVQGKIGVERSGRELTTTRMTI